MYDFNFSTNSNFSGCIRELLWWKKVVNSTSCKKGMNKQITFVIDAHGDYNISHEYTPICVIQVLSHSV